MVSYLATNLRFENRFIIDVDLMQYWAAFCKMHRTHCLVFQTETRLVRSTKTMIF